MADPDDRFTGKPGEWRDHFAQRGEKRPKFPPPVKLTPIEALERMIAERPSEEREIRRMFATELNDPSWLHPDDEDDDQRS